MNNYIILLFFVLFAIIFDPVTARPGEVLTESAELVNKQCPPKPKPNLFGKKVRLRKIGVLAGCWQYAITREYERFTFPPEVFPKLKLALKSNLRVYINQSSDDFAILSNSAANEENLVASSSMNPINNNTTLGKDVCPPKPVPSPRFPGYFKLKQVGIIYGCYDYGITDKDERFFIPPEAVDKLQLALVENLNVYMDLRENTHNDIAIYNTHFKENLETSLFENSTNFLASAKDANGCPPKPEPKSNVIFSLKGIGNIIGCFDYVITDKDERFAIPPETVDKIQLAVSENLIVTLGISENILNIGIFNRRYTENLETSSFENPTNILESAKDVNGCLPKPSSRYRRIFKSTILGRYIGCFDYVFFGNYEYHFIEPEAVDLLQLALVANLTVYYDQRNLLDKHIAVYSKNAGDD